MARRRKPAVTEWVRWLMGESRMPGRGHRAGAVQLLAVVALVVAGITAASTTMVHPGAPASVSSEVDPPTPPPGSLDLSVGPSNGQPSSTPSPRVGPSTDTAAARAGPAAANGAVAGLAGSPQARTRLPRAPKVPKAPRVRARPGAAAPTAPDTPTTTAPPATTTTTTTSPGGWA